MLLQGNSLKIPIGDKLVQCVVTSPPYYGLRDYGINGQLGLEPTLQEYIDNTVLWAREVRRVLRDDGTFWLNMGDSYAGSGGAGGDYNEGGLKEGQPRYKSPYKVTHGYKDGRTNRDKRMGIGNAEGLKPKDLMMVPHRVAIALQSDGWWVRSDIVWHKPNPMPGSVTDGPTKSHEYVFLLTKSKRYYYDADAVRDESTGKAGNRKEFRGGGDYTTQGGNIARNGKSRRGNRTPGNDGVPAARNKRSVWTITTKPYPGAHFATFAPEIPEICIKAGTSEKGVCPVCGNGWVRETRKETTFEGGSGKAGKSPDEIDGKWGEDRYGKNILLGPVNKIETIGWKPNCNHNEEPVPALVLDPFAGSGTTIMVANALGRKGIGIDLSWNYLQLARERTGAKALEEWVNGKKAESNLEGLPMFDS
jgi:DNA modification methylase